MFKTMVKSTEIKIEDVMGKKNEPFSPSMRMSPGKRPKGMPNFEARKIPPPIRKRMIPPNMR